jgi:hypothetical protein
MAVNRQPRVRPQHVRAEHVLDRGPRRFDARGRHTDLRDLKQRGRPERRLELGVDVRIRHQLGDVAAAVEEVERRRATVRVDDRRAFLDVGVAVELEQLVPACEPRSSRVDRAAGDVDREVVARLAAAGCRLEADRRALEYDLDCVADLPDRQAERAAPKARLGCRIGARERDLGDPHETRIPVRTWPNLRGGPPRTGLAAGVRTS